MQKAFTMIELIFVIVIIGILASVAIPKLSATRDDAKIVKELANLSGCVSSLFGQYVGKGDLPSGAPNLIRSCASLECFTVVSLDDINATITVEANSTGSLFCTSAQTIASKRHLDGNHTFGDKKVKY